MTDPINRTSLATDAPLPNRELLWSSPRANSVAAKSQHLVRGYQTHER
jgi:hypothetical protein